MANVDKKIQEVAQIKEKLSRAKSLVVVDYRGIKVSEDTELRKALREAGVEYKVIKNNLVVRACEGTEFEPLTKDLIGPSAFAFGYEDAVSAAKILKDMSAKYKAIEFKAGVVEGQYYGAEDMLKIASIPAREVLIAKFMGSIKSPLSNLAYMLAAIAKKKEEEASVEA